MVSAISSLTALYLLHRLVALDFDLGRARSTVWIAAWFPGAMVLSAVYSEPLLLLASVGAIYAARQGRWATAGLLGGVAAATRSGGVLLLVPLADPLPARTKERSGPEKDRAEVGSGSATGHERISSGCSPSRRAWSLFMAYLGRPRAIPPLSSRPRPSGTAASFRSAESGAGCGAACAQRSICSSPASDARPARSEGASHRPGSTSGRYCSVASCWRASGWSTRPGDGFPCAYTAYAICGLALALSFPATGSPLMSLPRFECVLFPLWIALGLWLHERGRHLAPVLAVFGALMAITSGLFALWVMAP